MKLLASNLTFLPSVETFTILRREILISFSEVLPASKSYRMQLCHQRPFLLLIWVQVSSGMVISFISLLKSAIADLSMQQMDLSLI